MCTPRPLGKSGTDRAESIRRIPQRGVIATAWPKSQSRFRKEKAALTNMPPKLLKPRTVLLFSDFAQFGIPPFHRFGDLASGFSAHPSFLLAWGRSLVSSFVLVSGGGLVAKLSSNLSDFVIN